MARDNTSLLNFIMFILGIEIILILSVERTENVICTYGYLFDGFFKKNGNEGALDYLPVNTGTCLRDDLNLHMLEYCNEDIFFFLARVFRIVW